MPWCGCGGAHLGMQEALPPPGATPVRGEGLQADSLPQVGPQQVAALVASSSVQTWQRKLEGERNWPGVYSLQVNPKGPGKAYFNTS